ncbi:hypothetical protein [Pseudanabaena sp. PCC 6802]|uniref:hypothetical protein n=1 Tax=Pseudanabaena sp. PCC 6802 TaxID=118173 RepID=UPI0003497FCE|nr:hypothetical protein [Pseudanabaena sp. PCC 6802]
MLFDILFTLPGKYLGAIAFLEPQENKLAIALPKYHGEKRSHSRKLNHYGAIAKKYE